MQPQLKVNTGIRIGSMILDHFIMTTIATMIAAPVMIFDIFSSLSPSHHEQVSIMGGPLLYVSLIGFALYFCKDIVNGRSLAKRVTRLQVVNNRTGEVASPLRCFFRNITCVLWPVEGIAALINPERRIGDFIAGTRMRVFDPVTVVQPKVKKVSLILPIVLSCGLIYLFILPFQKLLDQRNVPYVASSYNEQESKQLERILNDSLAPQVTADVAIYDSIKGERLKYISVIYQISDGKNEAGETKNRSNELLYRIYPEETFTGRVQYVYKTRTSTHWTSEYIGTPID